MSRPVAIITGCSSGLGMDLAILLAATHKVYATMRTISKRDNLDAAIEKAGVSEFVTVAVLDVCDDASVENCVKQVTTAEGRVDILVNNAGYSQFGTIEMCTIDEAKAQFDTNVFGVMRCTKAVLPAMRGQKSGKIINVSSIGGIFGQPFNDLYCASKFAVEGFAESQAALFREFGVYITNVEPGAIKSAFVSNAARPSLSSLPEDYQEPMKLTLAAYKRTFDDPSSSQTPTEVAQYIMDHVVNVAEPPLRVQSNASTYKDVVAVLYALYVR
eukprot:CFRG4117T1